MLVAKITSVQGSTSQLLFFLKWKKYIYIFAKPALERKSKDLTKSGAIYFKYISTGRERDELCDNKISTSIVWLGSFISHKRMLLSLLKVGDWHVIANMHKRKQQLFPVWSKCINLKTFVGTLDVLLISAVNFAVDPVGSRESEVYNYEGLWVCSIEGKHTWLPQK